jgi:biopolymer transport protein ExbD
MARKKKKRRPSDMLELNMTAMCDVIFQLLIYLILTANPMIVLAQLDVNRPSPDPNQMKPEKITGLVEVMVFTDAFVIQTKRVHAEDLGKAL